MLTTLEGDYRMVKKHSLKRKQHGDSSKKMWFFIIIFVVAIIYSTLNFVDFGGENSDLSTYNHFAFEQVGDKWQTQVARNNQVFEIPSYYHPAELEDYYFDKNVSRFFFNEPHAGFYLLVDEGHSNNPVIGAVNVARILGDKYFGFKIKTAIYGSALDNTTNSSIEYETCNASTELTPAIHFSVNETAPVVKMSETHPNCIIIGGANGKDVVKASDMFVFHVLGIME